ncbi:MAG: twin-arginine translocase TatA/TatE family subunit [Planctomycetota bacterium]|nr:MAG: twin-arginine translocase TatA/TatE family subunit [Planctomycetota bacterium]
MIHLAFGFPGGMEWLVVLIVALLIFGSRLPSVMRNLGRSVNEFKKGVNEVVDAAEAEERAQQKDEASA